MSVDLGRFLADLTPLLTATESRVSLAGTPRFLASATGAAAAVLFSLEEGRIGREWWSEAEPALRKRLRPKLVAAVNRTRESTSPSLRTCADQAGPLLLWTALFPDTTHPIGAMCLGIPCTAGEGHPVDWSVVRQVVELLGARIAFHRELERVRNEKEQQERWFKTLDRQLRVLDRERQKFVAVVNQSDTHVLVVDEEHVIRWTNSALRARLGDTESGGRCIGSPLRELWSRLRLTGPSSRPERCPVARAFRENVVVHEELHGTGEGAPRNLYLTALPIKGPDGRPEEVLIMVQDLSDLKVLRRSEARYRLLFERSPDAMIMVDPASQRIVLANPVAEELTGHERAELIGLPVEKLHDPDDWPQASLEYERVFSEEKPVVSECLLRTRTGGRITAVMSAARFDLDDHPVILVEFRDVTERKRLEAELRHSQKMEAIGRLAGGVAHDFNNILTVILGQAELLIGQRPGGDRAGVVAGRIQKAALRGSLLTRQLLAFSRKEVLKRETLDLREIVSEIEAMLRSLLGGGIQLHTALDGRPCMLLADRGQVEQILMNLVVNARDAMPAGGNVWIEVSRVEREEARGQHQGTGARESCVRLVVKDDGCGMDDTTQSRLFEPFFTTKDQGKGTGLGLSSAYGIIRDSGGDIDVSSRRGEGSTFVIHFPRVRGKRPTEICEIPVRSELEGGEETILVVEDEDEVRAMATEVLESMGYTVMQASSGEEALAMWKSFGGTIDLLLTDVIMPGMGGGELVKRVLAIRPEAKVLFMSGFSDDSVVQEAVTCAQASFLAKPFTLEGLSRKVREVLDVAGSVKPSGEAGRSGRTPPAGPRFGRS